MALGHGEHLRLCIHECVALFLFGVSGIAAQAQSQGFPACGRIGRPKSALGWESAAARPDSSSAPNEFRGLVISARDGKPLADAYVSAAPSSKVARSDSAGRFRIEGLSPGRYYVRVRYFGLLEAADSVTLGVDGLRLLAVLAHQLLGDLFCELPSRPPGSPDEVQNTP
jgi:hypothetical protein